VALGISLREPEREALDDLARRLLVVVGERHAP
jgi:hypothetical protein